MSRNKTVPERRRFLQGMVAVGGAGALVLLGSDEASARTPDTNQQAVDRTAEQGYRLSPHIRAYYASTRS